MPRPVRIMEMEPVLPIAAARVADIPQQGAHAENCRIEDDSQSLHQKTIVYI